MSDYSLNANLCRLVQTFPCMYDRKSPNYLKKDQVEEAWAKIARHLNEPVGSCKERWRNIRTAFARSVNIYKTPTGPNRHKRYYLHDELQFLTKHIAPGLPCLSTPVLTPPEIEEVNGNSQQSMIECEDGSTLHITLDTSETPPPNDTNEERPHPSDHCYTESMSSPVVKRRKMFINDPPSTDLDMDFLRTLLPEMRAMNARQKIVFKGRIFRTLEEIFDDLKDFPRPSSTLTQRSSNRNIAPDRMMDKDVKILHDEDEPIVTMCQSEIKAERQTLYVDD